MPQNNTQNKCILSYVNNEYLQKVAFKNLQNLGLSPEDTQQAIRNMPKDKVQKLLASIPIDQLESLLGDTFTEGISFTETTQNKLGKAGMILISILALGGGYQQV